MYLSSMQLDFFYMILPIDLFNVFLMSNVKKNNEITYF